MSRILFKGARLVDPASGRDGEGDLLVQDGKIREVGRVRAAGADETLDARGLILCPGLIDMHAHLREPGTEEEETIASGSAAAVAGGVTTVCAMPNTTPAVDNEASAEFVILQGARAAKANILPVGAITKGREGKELAEIGQLARAGAVAFSDDGNPVGSAEIMRRALEYAKMFNRPILSHCEDKSLAHGGCMHEGPVSTRLGLPGIPGAAEEVMAERDIALAELTGGKLHIAHASTARTIEAVRAARKRGIPVSCEATPHNLLLTDESVSGYDPNFKMYPPLRSRADVAALVEGMKDGTIDAIASDHAPHTREEKEMEFEKAPFGVIGMETMLAVSWTALGLPKILGWMAFLARLTSNPARILGLPSKGILTEGADADLVLIDPKKEWVVEPEKFLSKSRNCPFAGMTLTSKAVLTMVGGSVKHREA